MERGPWSEFLAGVIAPMMLALGVFHKLDLGDKASLPQLEQAEQTKTKTATVVPVASETSNIGTPVPAAPTTPSPEQRTKEARKRLAATEAAIAASFRELRKLGTREIELGQFTPPRLDHLSIDQAVQKEEERARKLAAFVTATKKRKAKLKAHTLTQQRKKQATSQVPQAPPPLPPVFQAPDEQNEELDETTVQVQ